MEGGFSALNINENSTNSNISFAKILKHYGTPTQENNSKKSVTFSRSPMSTPTEDTVNESKSSQISDKENLAIPELSIHGNRIIKHELFYERILRKFKEKRAAVNLASASTIQSRSPEDIFKEKIEVMRKELEKIEPQKKNEIFPGYSEEVTLSIKHQMSGGLNEQIVPGKNIKKNDLKTIYLPKAWLNDEVINHYLNMIVDRDPVNIHTFDTFFYTKLS